MTREKEIKLVIKGVPYHQGWELRDLLKKSGFDPEYFKPERVQKFWLITLRQEEESEDVFFNNVKKFKVALEKIYPSCKITKGMRQ